MTTKNTTEDTGSKKPAKKRIFYPNMYYLVDKDNYVIHHTANPEALKDLEYEDTDTILIAVHPSKLIKKKQVVNKIVLDFDKKLLTIDGDSCTLNKVDYEGNASYELDEAELKDWSKLISDCKKVANKFEMIGVPPIEGELLDVE